VRPHFKKINQHAELVRSIFSSIQRSPGSAGNVGRTT
jgi:hypothetical protein